MRKNKERMILVVSSDWHAGHQLGLMNPETKLASEIIDGQGQAVQTWNEYHLGHYQRYLWETVWEPGIKEVKKLADGSPVALIVNGDITQGQRHPEQLVTTSIANQFLIAAGAAEPWIEQIPNLKMVRFSYGTASHIFSEGTSPVIVSQLLKPKFPNVSIEVVHHGLLDVNGVTIDYAHHGPSQGIRLWTEGNQLRYYTKSIMLDHLKDGQKPPTLIIRSHYHYPKRERVDIAVNQPGGRMETVSSTIYLTPSMSGMTDYAQQATKSTPILYNGFYVFEIENGKVIDDHLDEFVWALDLRTKEKL